MKTANPVDEPCYFCKQKAEYSLIVTPRPKGQAQPFGKTQWFQSFCQKHWDQILCTGPLNLTRPIERKDLISQTRPRATMGRKD